MPSFDLDLVIRDLEGVPDKSLKGLESLGIGTLRDLVHHFPRRYEDRRLFDAWPAAPSTKACCVHGQVTDARPVYFGRSRKGGYFEAKLEPLEDLAFASPIFLRWFNMPFMKKVIAAGQELVVYGAVKQTGGKLSIAHPDYEIIEATGDAGLHMDRIVPVYRAASGVTQRFIRSWIHRALLRMEGIELDPVLPAEEVERVEAGLAPPERLWAFRQIHFPESFDSMRRAREYLALEEFAALQTRILMNKREWQGRPGTAHCGEGHLLADLVEMLPFPLTGAQRRAIEEIRRDLAMEHPMHRLLQGDVGAGKTLVAFGAMVLAVEGGFQAAMMAPTQILAEQHYLNFRKMADRLDLRISLRTSDRSEDNFAGGLFGGDGADIVIGTHALIHDRVTFDRLGLVVIDEQHKFGVGQRAQLAARGDQPDVLVMTATPIPRTLTMTVYGDLDVSILDELPKGRGEIISAVRPANKTREVTSFLKRHLEEGRQAYIVYPLVEQSEKLKSGDVTTAFADWSKRLTGFEVGLLHGKMSADEKEGVMGRFRANELQVLVATTVIEVGVDVPNANVMLIYNAERFGLAQLHQLRGRVGRGEHKSYCVFMVDPQNDEAMERLKILEETRDGFRIAEEDLRIRGPGDVLGTQQSGLPDLKFAALLMDTRLVQRSREVASRILAKDPDLSEPEHWELRRRVLGKAAGKIPVA